MLASVSGVCCLEVVEIMTDAASEPLVNNGDRDVEEQNGDSYVHASYSEITKYFLMMGWTAFGGPQAHIGMFETVQHRHLTVCTHSAIRRWPDKFSQYYNGVVVMDYACLIGHALVDEACSTHIPRESLTITCDRQLGGASTVQQEMPNHHSC